MMTLTPDVATCACPVGWVLLRGRVAIGGAGVNSWLQLDGANGWSAQVSLPVTRKGTLLEVVRIPPGCSRMVWLLTGDFEGGRSGQCLTMTPVGRFERVWRMLRRVVPMFYKQTRRKRLRAGLTIGKLLVDLAGAYLIAGKFRCYVPQMAYPDWLDAFDRLSNQDVLRIRRHSARFKTPPKFSILVTIDHGSVAGLSITLASLAQQLFPVTSVFLLLDDSETAQARSIMAAFPQLTCQLVFADGLVMAVDAGTEQQGWLVQVQCGDRLASHALYWLATEQQAHPQARIIYADDDLLDGVGQRVAPRFKPDWSLELLRATDYIGPFFAFSRELLLRLPADVSPGTGQGSYGFLLHLVDLLTVGEEVRHIAALLCHRASDRTAQTSDNLPAVRAHLERRGIAAKVMHGVPGVARISYRLPRQPLVSIIIPSRDSVELLRRSLDSIVEKSSYHQFEIILVDNQSALPETQAYFSALATRHDVSILRYAAPFNYSAMNNLGVAQARGEVVCLLNNDTEVITADWLEEMLGHLCQDRVGVVGAKLLYPDGRVQHGGDTVGPGGCAHHLHSFLERDAPGYCNRAQAAQDLSAVTAACMLTWRWLYLQLGGLDANHLQVAFNDVDYCLRVREAGYRVVWTPHAQLYHHESASRGKNDTPEKVSRSKAEADYMRKKWRHLMQHDPFYNPNLSYERPDFSLSNAPAVLRPWEC